MAVLWTALHAGHSYEVRSAGRTRRLYIDGLLNTEHNPARSFTGSLWDLLSLPALLARPVARRVLILGVGGGAVIHQLERLIAPTHVVGIELEAINLRIARRFFDLDLPHLELVQADAREWLTVYRGEPFDLIVDDLYAENDGEPVRAVKADRAWLRQIVRNLSGNGLAVFNHVGETEMQHSAALRDTRIRSRFAHALQLTGPRFENAVLALYRGPVETSTVGARLRAAAAEVYRGRAAARARFAARTLF